MPVRTETAEFVESGGELFVTVPGFSRSRATLATCATDAIVESSLRGSVTTSAVPWTKRARGRLRRSARTSYSARRTSFSWPKSSWSHRAPTTHSQTFRSSTLLRHFGDLEKRSRSWPLTSNSRTANFQRAPWTRRRHNGGLDGSRGETPWPRRRNGRPGLPWTPDEKAPGVPRQLQTALLDLLGGANHPPPHKGGPTAKRSGK